MFLPTPSAWAQSATPPPAASANAGLQAANETASAELDSLSQELSRSSGAVAANNAGPAGIVPYTKGFNASLVLSGAHDSSTGWAETTQPDVAYRFNQHFATNLYIPVYGTINIAQTPATNKKKTTTNTTDDTLVRREFLLGDLALDSSFETEWKYLSYSLTGTLGMPTGNDKDGLGAGKVTYAVTNHFEKQYFDFLTPSIDLGVSDNSQLSDGRVRKNYLAVGTSAIFEAGFGFDLPWSMDFSTDAYEDLPLSSQTVTSTATNGKKGKQLRTVTTTSQQSIGEDNGFENTLDIPFGRHMTLSGFYYRSLRNHTDTAGASLTFLLRGQPRDGGVASPAATR